jgi:hypothetical protein
LSCLFSGSVADLLWLGFFIVFTQSLSLPVLFVFFGSAVSGLSPMHFSCCLLPERASSHFPQHSREDLHFAQSRCIARPDFGFESSLCARFEESVGLSSCRLCCIHCSPLLPCGPTRHRFPARVSSNRRWSARRFVYTGIPDFVRSQLPR